MASLDILYMALLDNLMTLLHNHDPHYVVRPDLVPRKEKTISCQPNSKTPSYLYIAEAKWVASPRFCPRLSYAWKKTLLRPGKHREGHVETAKMPLEMGLPWPLLVDWMDNDITGTFDAFPGRPCVILDEGVAFIGGAEIRCDEVKELDWWLVKHVKHLMLEQRACSIKDPISRQGPWRNGIFWPKSPNSPKLNNHAAVGGPVSGISIDQM